MQRSDLSNKDRLAKIGCKSFPKPFRCDMHFNILTQPIMVFTDVFVEKSVFENELHSVYQPYTDTPLDASVKLQGELEKTNQITAYVEALEKIADLNKALQEEQKKSFSPNELKKQLNPENRIPKNVFDNFIAEQRAQKKLQIITLICQLREELKSFISSTSTLIFNNKDLYDSSIEQRKELEDIIKPCTELFLNLEKKMSTFTSCHEKEMFSIMSCHEKEKKEISSPRGSPLADRARLLPAPQIEGTQEVRATPSSSYRSGR